MPLSLSSPSIIEKVLINAHFNPLSITDPAQAIGQSNPYFRRKPEPSAPHNFIKDLIEYMLILLSQKKVIDNHRVAFVFHDDLALLIEYSNIDTARAKRISHHLTQHPLTTVDAVLEAMDDIPAFREDLQQLYRQIQAVCVTTTPRPAFLEKVSATLKHAFPNTEITLKESFIQHPDLSASHTSSDQTSWRDWLGSKIKQSTQTLYDSSLMKAGGDAFSWLAKQAKKSIPWKSEALHTGRQLISTSVKFAVFLLTFSPRLANRSAEATKALLTEEGLEDLMHPAGQTLGAIANTSLGGYYLFKMALITSGTQQLRNYFKSESIDLMTGIKTSNEAQLPSLHQLLRMNHALIAFLTALSTKNPHALLQTISGISGSIAFEQLGRFVSSELSDEGQLSPEDKHYLQLLFTIFGAEAGHALANSYTQIMDNLAARDAALSHLETSIVNPLEITDYHVDLPSLCTSIKNWYFDEEMPVTLFWRNNTVRYASQCEISLDLSSQTGVINCMPAEAHHIESLQIAKTL